MRSPMAFARTSSPYGTAQPPWAKPSRVSSSGRPGACMTPSSGRLLMPTILGIALLPWEGWFALYTNGVRADRHRSTPGEDGGVVPFPGADRGGHHTLVEP